MTNQSKRDILEEILTRLAILQAKVDYLVARTPVEQPPNVGKGIVEDGFKLTCNWPPHDHAMFGAFPKDVEENIIPMHRGDDGKLVHDNPDQDGGSLTRRVEFGADTYFNGEEWVERPEDLSYIQKFYKPDDAIQCLFDNLSPQDRMKPMGLSCPCRKCSAYC